MNYKKINFSILSVYQKFEIKTFPINCMDILHAYGMKIETYSEQKPAKYRHCLTYTGDAFSLKKKVYYNDTKPIGRIRFSLAHEIGHIALQHGTPRIEEHEDEADCFASYFLAPRMAIHYSGCKNQNDVAKRFHLSQEAALYAFNDYRRWYRRTIYHKMTLFDKAMYAHFYNEDAKCFVYKIKRCSYCNTLIYNSNSYICRKCKPVNLLYMQYQRQDEELLIAENQWLYRGL